MVQNPALMIEETTEKLDLRNNGTGLNNHLAYGWEGVVATRRGMHRHDPLTVQPGSIPAGGSPRGMAGQAETLH